MNDKTITINITTTNKREIQFILTNLEFNNTVIDYDRDIITSPKHWINATFELKKEWRNSLEKKYKTEKSSVSVNINFNDTIDNYKKINYNIYVNKKWRNYENI